MAPGLLYYAQEVGKLTRSRKCTTVRKTAKPSSCLPAILDGFVRAINETKTALSSDEEKSTNFEVRTLTKMCPMYGEIKQILKGTERGYEEEPRARELVGNMVSKINSWFRASRVACGVKTEMDPRYTGKAAIATKYELVISDSFDVTIHRGWN